MAKTTLIALIILTLCSGCSSAGDEETSMPEQTFLQKIAITQGTLLHADDGWGIGVQEVGSMTYTDDQGQEQFGPMARLAIGNNNTGIRAKSITIPVGGEFDVGPNMRFMLVAVDEGTSFGLPGSSTAEVYLGRIR